MSSTPTNAKAPPSRLADLVCLTNGFNAARVFAALLVVMLHASLPYVTCRIPTWILLDTSQHFTVDALIFGINGFVMPLFFLLSGMSIAKSCAEIPVREFAWNRCRRLGTPFLLGALLTLPLTCLAFAVGLLWTERITMDDLGRCHLPLKLRPYLIGPGHLWFLQYLLILTLAWNCLVRTARRWKPAAILLRGDWAQPALASVARPLFFALPTAVLFLYDPGTPFRLLSPVIPDLLRLLHYAVFLIAGVWIATMPQSYARLKQHSLWYLALGGILLGGLVPLTTGFLEQRLSPFEVILLSLLQALFAWCMVFGFLGTMLTWFTATREWMRYLLESSLWIYLVHLPVVLVLQLLVWQWPLPAWGKLLFVMVTTVGITLLSFETCVRFSLLGVLLHGSRKEHPTLRGWRLEAGWIGTATVAVVVTCGLVGTGWNAVFGRNLQVVRVGEIYRSNRLRPQELEAVIARWGIRSVISLSPSQLTETWDDRRGIPLGDLSFREQVVPSSQQLEQLQLALQHLPRPVLIVGGHRSPTLSGFGAAVAILADGGSPAEAAEQLGRRYFQVEGFEHCIVAKPLRDYRDWLAGGERTNSPALFREWTQEVQPTREQMAAAKEREPQWQSMMGAPRFPRRY